MGSINSIDSFSLLCAAYDAIDALRCRDTRASVMDGKKVVGHGEFLQDHERIVEIPKPLATVCYNHPPRLKGPIVR